MARKVCLMSNEVSAVRTLTGAPVAADSDTLTDANFPLLADRTTGGTVDCRLLATLWVSVEFDGGTNPSVELDPLIRDEGAPDGERWKRLLFGGSPAPAQPLLDGSGFVEVRVDGGQMFPRIKSVSGAPTSVIVLARPGALASSGRGLTPGNF